MSQRAERDQVVVLPLDEQFSAIAATLDPLPAGPAKEIALRMPIAEPWPPLTGDARRCEVPKRLRYVEVMFSSGN